jgi:hypothetical protein
LEVWLGPTDGLDVWINIVSLQVDSKTKKAKHLMQKKVIKRWHCLQASINSKAASTPNVAIQVPL